MKLWYHGFMEIERQPPYFEALTRYVDDLADEGITVVLHGASKGTYPTAFPGAYVTHVYTQGLRRRQFVEAAIQAEREGYDGFVIATMPDVALEECRSVVDIPVVGYWESALHIGGMVGSSIGVVTILEVLSEQLKRNALLYGFERLMGPIVPLGCSYHDVRDGFQAPDKVIESFLAASRIAISRGADVIVPGEGPLNVLLAQAGVHRVDDVPVVDSLGSAIRLCVALISMRRENGLYVTRKGFYYAKPPPDEVPS